MPRLAAVILLAALAALPASAPAESVRIRPALTLSESYNDNIFFKDKSDFEFLARPSLSVEYASERASARVEALYDIFRYAANPDLDRVNQRYVFEGSARLSPLVTATLSAGFTEDHSYESSLAETGIVTDLERRHVYSASPGVSFRLDPRTNLDLAYQFARTDYADADFTDYDVHGANARLSRLLSNQRTTVFATATYQHTAYEPATGSGDQDVYKLVAGAGHRFSERLSAMLGIGGSLTESRFTTPAGTTNKQDAGFLAQASLSYRFERLRLRLAGEKSITQSVYGENVNVEKLSTHLSYDLTERLLAKLYGAYIRSSTDKVVNDQKSEYYTFSPFLQFDFDEDKNIQAGYSFEQVHDKTADDVKTRNSGFVRVNVALPVEY